VRWQFINAIHFSSNLKLIATAPLFPKIFPNPVFTKVEETSIKIITRNFKKLFVKYNNKKKI